MCELPATEDPCDYNWKAFNGSCYRWFPQIGTFLYRPANATSWSKANQTCVEEWDAELVSIHSDEENKFVWGESLIALKYADQGCLGNNILIVGNRNLNMFFFGNRKSEPKMPAKCRSVQSVPNGSVWLNTIIDRLVD